ncbi:MAG TPA: 23S rRNA (guanosine(2251)-2'-O)-methyltransferase RlmB [Solirubrobacteraceae bacterium]|nr:23S rRNA (guanosine(2251)-2'-O)-methyltransferase RlmB [Solirubrobacteraceae bacterium]
MIVYGRNPVREAIRGPRTVTRVWATANARREPWLAQLSRITSGASADELERICGSAEHQGVCAEVSPFRYAAQDELLALPEPMIVALDQVQDPHNLGAIARSAECAGASGLVVPERRSAEVTPAVCKASAGAVEHLPIAKVRNLADFLTSAKRAGVWCYGADQSGAADYATVDFSGPLVLVLGSEGRGLRPRVAGACDVLVSIPVRGMIESLNVSAAAAVLIFAAARDRQGNLHGA